MLWIFNKGSANLRYAGSSLEQINTTHRRNTNEEQG
jgi:hypothetical protein